MTLEREDVLSTNDEEIARLSLQDRVWRDQVLDVWRRAGFGRGDTIVDVGCGSGNATLDLAEIVVPTVACNHCAPPLKVAQVGDLLYDEYLCCPPAPAMGARDRYSSVAQWQSIRLLTGGLLVRVQPEEPSP